MPLNFDMPLEKLHTYRGVNPCPADHDAYWARGLNEIDAIDPAVECIPAKFSAHCADCSDMYFTGTHGARIHAKLLVPKGIKKPRPAVLMFHGYSGSSGAWSDKLALVSQGYTVAFMDCRGQGGLSEDPGGIKGPTLRGHIIRGIEDHPDKLYYRQVFLDTVQMARIVMALPAVDETRVGVFGGSQGGALALACASLVPQIKLAAILYPFLSDYRRVWDMDLDTSAFAELWEYFRAHDPLHEREDQFFERLGYIDIQYLVHRIKAQVVMHVGLRDTTVPPSTQFASYNKINAPKDLVLYPDFGHELPAPFVDKSFEFLKGL